MSLPSLHVMTSCLHRNAGLTSLEVLAALVTLSLSAVGLMEVRAQSVAAGRAAEAMQRALLAADSALERAAPRADGQPTASEETIAGFAVRTATRSWRSRGSAGLAEVRIAVALHGRDTLVSHRLVRAR